MFYFTLLRTHALYLITKITQLQRLSSNPGGEALQDMCVLRLPRGLSDTLLIMNHSQEKAILHFEGGGLQASTVLPKQGQ